jgi:hypothetical protein
VISLLWNNPVHVGYALSSSSATSTFILCYSTLFSSQVKYFQSSAKNRRQLQKRRKIQNGLRLLLRWATLHPAFSPQLFHLLLLVAAEAQVVVCRLDLYPANHAKHNNPNQN